MNEPKVGDLITAYHAGYHRVVGFHVGYGNTKQVEYQTVLTANGKPCNKKTRSCHVNYCAVVDEGAVLAQFDAEVKAAEEKRDNLLKALSSL